MTAEHVMCCFEDCDQEATHGAYCDGHHRQEQWIAQEQAEIRRAAEAAEDVSSVWREDCYGASLSPISESDGALYSRCSPPVSFGPFKAILNPDGTLRGNGEGDPYVFMEMGLHDNHSEHGRRVVRVRIEVMP